MVAQGMAGLPESDEDLGQHAMRLGLRLIDGQSLVEGGDRLGKPTELMHQPAAVLEAVRDAGPVADGPAHSQALIQQVQALAVLAYLHIRDRQAAEQPGFPITVTDGAGAG